MGRSPLRRHSIRYRNRATKGHRSTRRHPSDPRRLATRCKPPAPQSRPTPIGVSNYRAVGNGADLKREERSTIGVLSFFISGLGQEPDAAAVTMRSLEGSAALVT